jgi:hypothetical protein
VERIEKLLPSRCDTVEFLSLSIRSVDCLVTTGRLMTRKILIPDGAVRRFIRGGQPKLARTTTISASVHGRNLWPPSERFLLQG